MTEPEPVTNIADVRAAAIREDQGKRLAVLDELLAVPLPAASWLFDNFTGVPLRGMIPPTAEGLRKEADVRAELALWAEFLGAAVNEKPHRRYIELTVLAWYNEVPVTIWAHIAHPREAFTDPGGA